MYLHTHILFNWATQSSYRRERYTQMPGCQNAILLPLRNSASPEKQENIFPTACKALERGKEGGKKGERPSLQWELDPSYSILARPWTYQKEATNLINHAYSSFFPWGKWICRNMGQCVLIILLSFRQVHGVDPQVNSSLEPHSWSWFLQKEET